MKKLKDAIYGFAVADALGVPYEFKKRGSFNCTEMLGYGTHNQPAGTWSDDTSMVLATLESIKRLHKVDSTDIMNNFVKWLYEGEFTPFGEVFDIGTTTYKSIKNFKRDKDIKICGIDFFYNNGNGGLMRILPLAFLDASDEIIDEVTALTHAHSISKEASRIYVNIVRALLSGKDIKETLKSMSFSEDYKHLLNLEKFKEKDISSRGFVISTLTAVLWCFINTDNYKDCVLKAVNLGDDTDTVAAIAGALAGIKYGIESIPIEWMDNLKNKELIEKCILI